MALRPLKNTHAAAMKRQAAIEKQFDKHDRQAEKILARGGTPGELMGMPGGEVVLSNLPVNFPKNFAAESRASIDRFLKIFAASRKIGHSL